MTKQLTQEQIDSLNAIYAKIGDNSLQLEVTKVNCSNWARSYDESTPNSERIENVMERGSIYRIKPQAPKKRYYKFEGAELPAPLTKATYYENYDNQVTCTVTCSTGEDAKVWHDFFLNISDARNVIFK